MSCLLLQRWGGYGAERRAEAAQAVERAGGAVVGGRPRASDMHHFSLFHYWARRCGQVRERMVFLFLCSVLPFCNIFAMSVSFCFWNFVKCFGDADLLFGVCWLYVKFVDLLFSSSFL